MIHGQTIDQKSCDTALSTVFMFGSLFLRHNFFDFFAGEFFY